MDLNTSFSEKPCNRVEDVMPQDMIGRLDVRICFGFIYFGIFSVGFAGNLLVLYGLLKHCMSFQGIRPEYILSLTSADVLIVCSSLPINGVQTFVREWIFGEFACRVIPILQGIGVFATSFTMVAIAADRYRCIVMSPVQALKRAATFRYKDDREKHKHWPITVAIWTLSILLSAPYGIFLRYAFPMKVCGYFCVEEWPDESFKSAYGFAVFILQFLLPMLICTFCYYTVYIKVKNQTLARRSHEQLSAETRAKIRQRRRRILLLATLMLVSFLLSWLPMNVLNLMRDFQLLGKVVPKTKFAFSFAVAHCLAMSSVFWDPLIYSFCNPQFRELVCISRQEGIRRHSARVVRQSRFLRDPQSFHSSLEHLALSPQNGLRESSFATVENGVHPNGKIAGNAYNGIVV